MPKEEVGADKARRNFLKLATVSVPAMAVSAAATGSAVAAQEVVKTGGLQMTEHVKAYLESARF